MDELTTLEKVISSVEIVQLLGNEGPAYRLQKGSYFILLRQLDELHKRAPHAFEVFGTPLPPRPTWGRNEDPRAFYAANEYEILGICYRAEVENYLATLDQCFDFAANEVRPPDEEVKQQYEEYRRSVSIPARKIGSPADNTASSGLDGPSFRLRPAFSPESQKEEQIKEEETDVQHEPIEVPNLVSDNSGDKTSEEEKDSSEEESFLPRSTVPRSAFAKSSTPPTRFHEAFGRITFGKAEKPQSRSRKSRGDPAPGVNFGDGKRDVPPHISGLGFAIPTHSTKPSQSTLLKPSKPKSKNSGDDSSDSDEGKGKKKRNGKKRRDNEGGRKRGASRPSRKTKDEPEDSTDDEKRDGRYFDMRLKDSDVPKWDGNPDTLLRWIQRCNLIAEDGPKA
ncbi:hypothetical protein B0H14DRAFT_3716989 [Mycena olivaceomarginata]|nr:hypothetical protein B0H14DRAFT_3716989 [Mycena olivaceomarginata]